MTTTEDQIPTTAAAATPAGDPAPAATPTAPAPAPAAADPAPADPAPAPAAATTDWRDEMAGGDKEYRAYLDRFADAKSAVDSAFSSNKEFKKGGFTKKLPENPTPEQQAEWNKENNVPAAATEYSLELSGGRVLGEADKPHVDKFLADAHAQNMPQAYVTKMLEWYADFNTQIVADQAKQIAGFKEESTTALRSEWGTEYQANSNLADMHFSSLPPALQELYAGAVDVNGNPLAEHPDFRRFLVNEARFRNPTGIMMPSSNDPGASVQQEVESLQKELRGLVGQGKTLTPAKQDRLAQLVTWQEEQAKLKQQRTA